MVELWTDNSLPSATVGSNLHQVWCINRSEGETPLLLIQNIAERRAFGFMIHDLMLAVNISNCESYSFKIKLILDFYSITIIRYLWRHVWGPSYKH